MYSQLAKHMYTWITSLTPILELNTCVLKVIPWSLYTTTPFYVELFTTAALIFLQTMLRIWDTFLYEGSKVLFRFAIAIFKYNEEALLSKDNSIAIFNHLRTMCQDATDVNRLVQVSWQQSVLAVQSISHLPYIPLTTVALI